MRTTRPGLYPTGPSARPQPVPRPFSSPSVPFVTPACEPGPGPSRACDAAAAGEERDRPPNPPPDPRLGPRVRGGDTGGRGDRPGGRGASGAGRFMEGPLHCVMICHVPHAVVEALHFRSCISFSPSRCVPLQSVRAAATGCGAGRSWAPAFAGWQKGREAGCSRVGGRTGYKAKREVRMRQARRPGRQWGHTLRSIRKRMCEPGSLRASGRKTAPGDRAPGLTSRGVAKGHELSCFPCPC